MRPFRYTAVDTGDPDFIHTRVLSILPDLSPRGNIQCVLEELSVPLGEQSEHYVPEYAALSYVWGPAQPSIRIEVNELSVRVRKNLWDFLDVCRKHRSSSKIWIDAVCIDQSNLAERNHLVRSMGLLYNRASVVLVWLGSHDSCMDEFFDIVQYDLHDKIDPDMMLPEFDEDIQELLDTARTAHSMTADDFQRTIDKIFVAEYWFRAWIWQETLLARKLIYMRGTRTMSEPVAGALMGLRSDSDAPTAADYVGTKKFHGPSPQLYVRETWKVFSHLRYAHCSDVRDRIYGCLSLIRGGAAFTVDYSEDTFGLLLRTILFLHSDVGDRPSEFGFSSRHYQKVRFREWHALARSLELGDTPLWNELNLRAASSPTLQRLSKSFETESTLIYLRPHAWRRNSLTRSRAKRHPNGGMICPDCSIFVAHPQCHTEIAYLCCLHTAGLHCHIVIASGDNDEISGGKTWSSQQFVFVFDGRDSMCSSHEIVLGHDYLRLSLSACLFLLQAWDENPEQWENSTTNGTSKHEGVNDDED